MKRLFLALVMAIVFVLALTVAVSAESVHNGKVDLNQKVTLSDGTECALFDAEGNALIWYKDANGALQSIKAQDERVLFYCTYQFGVGNSVVGSVTVYEISKIEIALESGTLPCSSIVVFNIMDDDVLSNAGGSRLNNPVNCIRSNTFINSTNLEYAFLRLDTSAIQASAFQGCSNLKYVNLEHLTELRQFGGGSCFSNCTSLFVGEVLDLSNTKLCAVSGTGTFNNVKLKGVILPNTVADLGDWNFQGMSLESFAVPTGVTKISGSTFNDTKTLKTIYINNTLTSISDRAFNNTALEKIFYVGTLDQLNALLAKASKTNNAPFWAVVGENNANVISYADYKNLEDKSGKYVVYDYSYCEAYNNGNHSFDPEKSNDCAGICGTCSEVALKANPIHNYVTTISYANGYTKTGIKTQTCQNAGCAHENGYDTDVDAVVDFRGVSVKESGDALTFGYVINYNALDELVKITGKSVELGFVTGVKSFISGDVYGNENAVTASVVTWKVETEEVKNEAVYANADFILRGTWDKNVDLDGDEVEETDVKNVEFYMAGYLATNGAVSYLNASDSFLSPDVVTYNMCNSME